MIGQSKSDTRDTEYVVILK